MATQAVINQTLGLTNQNLSPVTVTIGELKIDAYSAHAEIGALPLGTRRDAGGGESRSKHLFLIDLKYISQTDGLGREGSIQLMQQAGQRGH